MRTDPAAAKTAGEAKFSEAMSCSVVFWRSLSRSRTSNSSVSLATGHVPTWGSLDAAGPPSRAPLTSAGSGWAGGTRKAAREGAPRRRAGPPASGQRRLRGEGTLVGVASSRRRRLGVALVLDPPVRDEVDGLRRALGDGSIERVPPHLTLVPPVNVPVAALSAALCRLRAAAAQAPGPLRLCLGPPSSFLPRNPVLYLSVGGDLEELSRMRDAVFGPPLAREMSWPWVPHVTLVDEVTPERAESALVALDRYATVVVVDRLVLLEESGRAWRPLADAALGPPLVVGRGGLALEITEGRLLDPEAASALEVQPDEVGVGDRARLVLTARREGAVVGAAAAWLEDDGGHVVVSVVPGARGQGVGSHLLGQAEAAVERAGWRCGALTACGPPGFYAARSARSRVKG